MEYGESLTLKEAAAFAGVSEGTMRTWVKDISNIRRYPGGGYGIPRDELTSYLGSKQWRKSGATKGYQAGARVTEESEAAPHYLLQLLEEVKGEREGLKQELNFARERIRYLENRNGDLESNLIGLTREMRELIYGNGKPGLSAWMTKVKAPEGERENTKAHPVTVKKVAPVKVKKPLKSPLKSKNTKSKSTKTSKVIKKKSAAKSGKNKR